LNTSDFGKALYFFQVKAGAFMGFHAGWEMAEWFAEPGQQAEYKPSFHRLI
jgi:hypothetical protein